MIDLKYGYPINGTIELDYSFVKKIGRLIKTNKSDGPFCACYNCQETVNIKQKKSDSWTTFYYCEECKHLTAIIWQESHDGIRAKHPIEVYELP